MLGFEKNDMAGNFVISCFYAFGLILISFIIYHFSTTTEVCRVSKIVSIGGCDEYGNCSALLDDGVVITRNKPVPGAIYDICDRFDDEMIQDLLQHGWRLVND